MHYTVLFSNLHSYVHWLRFLATYVSYSYESKGQSSFLKYLLYLNHAHLQDNQCDDYLLQLADHFNVDH